MDLYFQNPSVDSLLWFQCVVQEMKDLDAHKKYLIFFEL